MKQCKRCGETYMVSLHEPLMGSNRKTSIKYKLQVPLCFNCHRFAHDEPSQEYNNLLKIQMQIEFEKSYSREFFIKEFGRNYIED